MIKSSVVTASGVVEGVSCQLHTVSVTKAGTTSTVNVYDNATTNSGNKVYSGDGAVVQNCPLGQGPGQGVVCTRGIYVEITGTPGIVVVTYE